MGLPPFHGHVEVWALAFLLGGGYAWALRRLGPRRNAPGEPAASRKQVAWFALGVASLVASAAWPVHDLSEDYLYSVHMLQHMLLTFAAAPLLLLGVPAWLLRSLVRPRVVNWTVRWLARPFFALVLFNAVLVLTHWPRIVDVSLHHEAVHFAAHAALFGSSLLLWWPVVRPLPEMPTLSRPGSMLYLFLQSIVPTVPASFLTFGSSPLYRFYEDVPRIWRIDALTDQRIAGLLMKLGGGAVLWTIAAVIFFRWWAEEQASEGWDDLEFSRVERDVRRQLTRR